jgi:hypothetical protein
MKSGENGTVNKSREGKEETGDQGSEQPDGGREGGE